MPMNLGNLADSGVGTREEGQRLHGAEATGGPAKTLGLVLLFDESGMCLFRRDRFSLPPPAHSRSVPV